MQLLAAFLLMIVVVLVYAADPSQLVKGLPGQPDVDFDQYAGHITVDAAAGRNLFYWLYPSPYKNASSVPLVLWLNGGPGCSSVGFGALAEMGPFRVNESATGLLFHRHAWNQDANLLFLEAPYGVGFSYSETDDYYSNDQTASDNLIFLIHWFDKFPEYMNNEFYLTGESFAGQYVPTLASHILTYNRKTREPRINLKGFALGNAFTSPYYEKGYTLDFFYSHSLISREAYEEELESCYMPMSTNWTRCDAAMNLVSSLTQFVDPYNVYKRSCTKSGLFNRLYPEKGFGRYDPCVDLETPYLNLPEVQAALNIKPRPLSWKRCNNYVLINFHARDPDGQQMLRLYKEFFNAGLKIWIYSGDFDSVVPVMSSRSWIDALNLTVEKPWYPWRFNDQVGGWSEVYSELTFVTIRGSGHLVPTDKPQESLVLFRHFLQGEPLPSFSMRRDCSFCKE